MKVSSKRISSHISVTAWCEVKGRYVVFCTTRTYTYVRVHFSTPVCAGRKDGPCVRAVVRVTPPTPESPRKESRQPFHYEERDNQPTTYLQFQIQVCFISTVDSPRLVHFSSLTYNLRTFEHYLAMINMNQLSQYLDRRLFHSNIMRTLLILYCVIMSIVNL